jgi:hypothetical protein
VPQEQQRQGAERQQGARQQRQLGRNAAGGLQANQSRDARVQLANRLNEGTARYLAAA